MGGNNDINITSVNLPASIRRDNDGASVKFLDGGMMCVSVKGAAKTSSKGWTTTHQNDTTTFRKYGPPSTIKIER